MNMDEIKADWRWSRGQEAYRMGARLIGRTYTGEDHEHGAFCRRTIHAKASASARGGLRKRSARKLPL